MTHQLVGARPDVVVLNSQLLLRERRDHIGTYSYKVHGAGCRFVRDNGTEVDVDFAPKGAKSSTSGGCAGMG
ncbi:DUF6896 domain-containing protein [Streptomyces sp. NPDC093598]|uniref:DUF6896 domain-containing protein n=1 Tax=Streptomyces sp. NPDC093598 TaxID=3366046 RepID=UPI0037FE2F8F